MSEMTKNYDALVEEVLDVMNGSENIWVFMHENPDGDAYGSSLALTLALKGAGKEARVFQSESVPRMYVKMPEIHILECPDELPDDLPDTIIVLDNGAFERIGEPYHSELVEMGVVPGSEDERPRIINIDHHVSNTHFGDINLVCTDCAATGIIVHDIIKKLDCDYSPVIAENVYIAVITDTGRFAFSNTNRRALDVAGELVDLGVKPSKVVENIYYTRKASQMRLFARILSTLTEMPEAGVIYAWMTLDMLEETGTVSSDSEGAVDLMRTISDFSVSVFLKETDSGTKVSLRSKGSFNAAEFAVEFGGGGHPGAAGFKIDCGIEEAVGVVIEKLGALLKVTA